MSPLSQRGGDMLVYPCPLVCLSLCCESSMLWVCLPFISLHSFVSCRRSNTRRWPNAGLMLAHRLRRWPTINPVLGFRVVFGTTLNVGQRHRRRANINPALLQSIVTLPPACMYLQHEVLTRTECILASTGDAGPTFNRGGCLLVIAASSIKQYQASCYSQQTQDICKKICTTPSQRLWRWPNIVQML